MAKRDFKLLMLGLLFGAMIGTLLGQVLTFLLPDDSAVKVFFLTSFFRSAFEIAHITGLFLMSKDLIKDLGSFS